MANDQELIKEVYPISILRKSQQNKDEGEQWISEDVIKKWTDNPQGVSPEYPYEFCCTRYYTYKNKDNPSEGKGWQPWDTKNISLWAHYGMNATPYQLLLGNPYESIYQIEASAATREAYVIIDGDGISTGEIILQGGYENKDQKFNLKIDEISILDPISNIEHHFEETNNYLTINLGDNWKCRFERSNNNGNPVLKIIGIGPNPESSVTPPSTIELAPTDSCFKCNLGGKYQKKIIIQAKNNQKHITATATWTVTAIRDKNGDGIWRYQIMPSIDRVVRNIYYKRIGEDDKAVTAIKDVWNIGDANSLKFDLEKDTYGKSWEDIDLSKQKCRIRIGRPKGNNEYEVLYDKEATSNPVTIDCDKVKSIFNGFLSNKSLLEPHMAQYIVELFVEDPDYGEGFSVVDKCNLVFEYIVSESGKDGEDGENGKDGTSSVFNLSNDSGSFAYNYKSNGENCEIILNDNDKTTDIQYSVESNYKCCDSIKIGETLYEETTTGSYDSTQQGSVSFKLTKNTEDWTLEITGITTSQYKSVFAIPITGIIAGKEVGTATFKMVGIRDLNKDGAIYSYRLVPEHTHSQEHSSETDYLDVKVYREALIEGPGYNDEIGVVVQTVSKLEEIKPGETKLGKTILGTSDVKKVKCGHPAEIRTNVSMYTVQQNHGVTAKVYAVDEDYEDENDKITVGETTYYFTGEAEDIPWTAPQGIPGPSVEVDYEELKKSIKTISCNNDSIIVTGGSTYTFRFTDIGGNVKDVTLSLDDDASKFFDSPSKNNTSKEITLTAKSYDELSKLDPFSGEITYTDSTDSNISGTIRYTWVGDSNSDGAYYDYVIEPSAQVLGYTTGENNELEFNIKQITATCKCIKHQGLLKSNISKKDSYVTINGSLEQAKKLPEGDIITIKFQDPPASSESTDTNLYYNKTDSFRIGWYVNDTDFEKLPADSISFLKIGEIKYYLVDSELIDVVPNTAIDATQNLQAYTGSGSFVIDPKKLTATFEYKSDAPGFYKIRFNNAQYQDTGDIYFTDTASTHKGENIRIIMGPELMQTSKKSETPLSCTKDIDGPYILNNSNQLDKEGAKVAWIKCPSVHVGIYKENTFETLLFEDTVVRTGLDGYYWNVDENGLVSLQSNGDVMTSINQTANSIVSIASGVSPNLCQGAATKKTSLFDWIDLSNGSPVTNYSKSQIITAPNKECKAGTFSSVPLSGTQYTYSASNFELNEGYYGISLSPTSVTTGGTITIGYDGPLLYENYSAPSGSAIAISGDYNGKGIKFTASNALKGDDYILSFYASSTNASIVYVKANNTIYQFETTSNVKRYVLKLNKLSSLDVTIYKDQEDSSSSILYISSIQFEKGSLVTDWKDYGQDVSSIIQDASSIRAEVESIKGDYASKSSVTETANGIKSEVATIKKGQEELKSYIDEKPTGIDMATVVNGIRTAGINIKNGETDVTDGKIYPNSGSVELTGQVIATNFMVKSGAHSLAKMREEGSKIVMCITTWKNAKELGTNKDITLDDDDVPVFVIKSKNKFFVLNPLLLTNSGIYPASYEAIATLLYKPNNTISLNDIISNKSLKTIFKYSMPSQKEVGGKKIDVIQGATAHIGVMCKDENYENLDADPPTFNTNSLLNDFTIKFDRTITAPVYILDGQGEFITFVPIDIYKVIKYTDGGIELGDERLIFLGSRVSYSNGKVSLSPDSKVLYKLEEYPKSLLYFEKNFTCISNESVTVKLKGFITKKIADEDPPIFITNIETTEFKYLFCPEERFRESEVSNFVKTYSSEPFKEFTEREKQNFLKKYSIEVKYREFLDSYYTYRICQKYGIDYNDFPEFQQTNN